MNVRVLPTYIFIMMACIISVLFAYFCIDRAMVFFVDSYHINQFSLLYWMQRLPELLIVLIPISYTIIVIRYFLGYRSAFDNFVLTLIFALLITIACVDQLKFVFGRYWPDTFIENNLSLLQNAAYGFNWFHGGAGYRSFPSGHTATIFSAMTVTWHYYPKLRWLVVLACSAVMVGLIGMHYHFVSDVIAGACLGFFIGDSLSRMFSKISLQRVS